MHFIRLSKQMVIFRMGYVVPPPKILGGDRPALSPLGLRPWVCGRGKILALPYYNNRGLCASIGDCGGRAVFSSLLGAFSLDSVLGIETMELRQVIPRSAQHTSGQTQQQQQTERCTCLHSERASRAGDCRYTWYICIIYAACGQPAPSLSLSLSLSLCVVYLLPVSSATATAV